MTPHDARLWLQEFLPARDSRVWSLAFWGGLLTLLVTEFPELVPDGYEPTLTRLAVFLTVVGGKMGWSWAQHRPTGPLP